MSRLRLGIRVLVALGTCLSAGLAQAQKVYWVERAGDVVGFANRDGTSAGSFAVGTDSLSQGLAVDALNGHVYWSELAGNKVRRADLDGTNMVDIISGVDALSIALDVYREKIYWTEDDGTNDLTKVQRANLNGTSIETVVATSPNGFSLGIALDVKHDKVYWTEFLNQTVRRANLDGTGVETIVTSSGNVTGIAVDTTNDKIYWGACTDDIRRANLDGSSLETIVPAGGGFPCPVGLSLDVPNGKLYWSDENGLVRRANLDGTSTEDLLTGLSSPEGLGLDEPPELPAGVVPAVSDWGLIALLLLLVIAATVVLLRVRCPQGETSRLGRMN